LSPKYLKLADLFDKACNRALKIRMDNSDFLIACSEVLKEFTFEKFTPEDLLVLEKLQHPEQSYPTQDFSEKSITLFRSGDLFLDLYWWEDRITSKHDHNFFGAFKVIQGIYFQQIFSFDSEKILMPGVVKGTTRLINQDLKPPGHVEIIPMGESFIHQVYHLNGPSVTLCLRTRQQRKTTQNYLGQYRIEGPIENPNAHRHHADAYQFFQKNDHQQARLILGNISEIDFIHTFLHWRIKNIIRNADWRKFFLGYYKNAQIIEQIIHEFEKDEQSIKKIFSSLRGFIRETSQ
jgi:hypothetical protein